jgi:hypothetical protein
MHQMCGQNTPNQKPTLVWWTVRWLYRIWSVFHFQSVEIQCEVPMRHDHVDVDVIRGVRNCVSRFQGPLKTAKFPALVRFPFPKCPNRQVDFHVSRIIRNFCRFDMSISRIFYLLLWFRCLPINSWHSYQSFCDHSRTFV